jgi:hypothetical protein
MRRKTPQALQYFPWALALQNSPRDDKNSLSTSIFSRALQNSPKDDKNSPCTSIFSPSTSKFPQGT